MKIIGIDPGSRFTGYGILDVLANRKINVLGHGVVKAPPKAPLEERLHCIHTELEKVLETYEPEVMVVEEIFFSHDVRSALALGHVRGIILLAGARYGIPIASYASRVVKQAVSGSGRADKSQVKRMISKLLCLQEEPLMDAADALAIAMCHANSFRIKNYDRLSYRKSTAKVL